MAPHFCATFSTAATFLVSCVTIPLSWLTNTASNAFDFVAIDVVARFRRTVEALKDSIKHAAGLFKPADNRALQSALHDAYTTSTMKNSTRSSSPVRFASMMGIYCA